MLGISGISKENFENQVDQVYNLCFTNKTKKNFTTEEGILFKTKELLNQEDFLNAAIICTRLQEKYKEKLVGSNFKSDFFNENRTVTPEEYAQSWGETWNGYLKMYNL